jgi:hypothetical protein
LGRLCRIQWAGQGSDVVAAVASIISTTIIYNIALSDKVTRGSHVGNKVGVTASALTSAYHGEQVADESHRPMLELRKANSEHFGLGSLMLVPDSNHQISLSDTNNEG